MAILSSKLQSVLDNRLRYLPEITGRAINSIDWPTKLIEIGRKFGMHVDEMEDFQEVVLKAMIGLIPPDQFEQALITALALSPANAEKAIEDINNGIFGPIHDFVMNGGKPVDPLRGAGIVIDDGMGDEGMGGGAGMEAGAPQAPRPSVATNELDIPQVPAAQPTNQRPVVTGVFEDFFVHPPTTTDQSMVK